MYVCMCVCMYVCTHVCMYAVRECVNAHVRMCMFVRVSARGHLKCLFHFSVQS